MGSVSEKSFGARLLHAQNILTYIQNLPGYAPPDQSQSASNFGGLLTSITGANLSESELEQQYKAAVQARRNAFRGNANSLVKLLPQIRGAVQAQFGKASQQYAAVSSIINNMNAIKLTSPPPAAGVSEQNVAEQATISQSQQSYGSLVAFFWDLIATLQQMVGYNPSNTTLQINSLQDCAENLDFLNGKVAEKYQPLHAKRAERLDLYEDLGRRVQGIKAYIKAQYGTQSEPYALVKGVKV